MSGKRISVADLANMLEFSLRTQLMMDRKSLNFGSSKGLSTIKAGKVVLPKNLLWGKPKRCNPGTTLAKLSQDQTRWSARLIK